ncbi:hypothetical protein QBC37DRAFT_243084, partial [Rhypophila decipiens]
TTLRLISGLFGARGVSIPASLVEISSRVKLNFSRFFDNYVAAAAIITLYSLLTNWDLLLDMVFIATGDLLIRKLNGGCITFGERKLTTSQLYTLLYVTALLVMLRYLISIIGTTGLLVLSHALLIDNSV